MKNILINIGVGLCLLGTAYAQELNKHEASVYALGGFSSFQYELSQEGKHSTGVGGGIGIAYTYRLNRHFGISIGGEFQSYQSRAHFDEIKDSYPTTDIESEEMNFRYQAKNYQESQYANFLNIPVSLRYETGMITGFYVEGGVKIGFPISSEYRSKVQELHTSGYYPQWDAELEAPMFMGFGEHKNIATSRKKLELKNTYTLFLEMGVKQRIGKKSKVYIGAFFEYGLNTLEKSDAAPNLIEYQTEHPSKFMYHSMFASPRSNGKDTYAYDLRTLAYGVKFRYAFSL